jgi:hypothetical protein
LGSLPRNTAPAHSCSDSHVVAPVLDTVLGGVAGLTFLTAAGSTDAMWEMNNGRLSSRTNAIAVFGPLAALEAASAYYGYSRVHACGEAKQQALERVQLRIPNLQPFWPPAAMPPPAPQARQRRPRRRRSEILLRRRRWPRPLPRRRAEASRGSGDP